LSTFFGPLFFAFFFTVKPTFCPYIWDAIRDLRKFVGYSDTNSQNLTSLHFEWELVNLVVHRTTS
jgi:hypothetical protein